MTQLDSFRFDLAQLLKTHDTESGSNIILVSTFWIKFGSYKLWPNLIGILYKFSLGLLISYQPDHARIDLKKKS